MDFDLIPKEDVDEITDDYYQRLEKLKNQIFEDNF